MTLFYAAMQHFYAFQSIIEHMLATCDLCTIWP